MRIGDVLSFAFTQCDRRLLLGVPLNWRTKGRVSDAFDRISVCEGGIVCVAVCFDEVGFLVGVCYAVQLCTIQVAYYMPYELHVCGRGAVRWRSNLDVAKAMSSLVLSAK